VQKWGGGCLDRRLLPNRSVELGRGSLDVDIHSALSDLPRPPRLRITAAQRHRGKETQTLSLFPLTVTAALSSLYRVDQGGCIPTTSLRKRRMPALLSYSRLFSEQTAKRESVRRYPPRCRPNPLHRLYPPALLASAWALPEPRRALRISPR